ncbi:hypothetical protein [Aestuariicoccus sp. MJ-SS9]|uniref:hypothetical protein n=1 Tax=Aestuariicoccus sp. MJ-SS9 TaxID=3079855 RepID=UPI00290C346D|nr:hypothetical protein [Aestuariicoccus sp. MJ-SS9]MDU8913973.1 hypothetical protein [Aestuariicoccus sp. MJ-SS9]
MAQILGLVLTAGQPKAQPEEAVIDTRHQPGECLAIARRRRQSEFLFTCVHPHHVGWTDAKGQSLEKIHSGNMRSGVMVLAAPPVRFLK